MGNEKQNIKKVSVTAHDGYIGFDWETEEEHGSYEFEKTGRGWKAYSSKPDEDLGFLQELIQAALLRVETED